MPRYCFRCKDDGCAEVFEFILPMPDASGSHLRCTKCDGELRRDYAAERAYNTFRPTVDLYAKSKKV